MWNRSNPIDGQWTFLSFFAIFEFGSVLCGAATSSNMLIVGRAFAGMGGSGLLNGAYTIIHASVPPEKKAGMSTALDHEYQPLNLHP